MITIIYTFRNRGLDRIIRSLESLDSQRNKDFNVIFVDYGSDLEIASKIEEIVKGFSFCKYVYTYSLKQPWCKARAINIALKMVETDFVFTADIDMIFHPKFIDTLNQLKSSEKAIFFKVGFLSKEESKIRKEFDLYQPEFYSREGATGLSLFPTKTIKELRGIDEFFHFWGAEDENIHMRFENAGYKSEFYQEETLLLHQWHQTYRNSENVKLSKYLRLDNIVPINGRYNINATNLGQTKVNEKGWGYMFTKETYEKLLTPDKNIEITTLKSDIDAIGNVLCNSFNKTISITFKEPNASYKREQRVKKLLFKKYFPWYSINETNNILLFQLISQHRNKPYNYEVSEDLNSIKLTISL